MRTIQLCFGICLTIIAGGCNIVSTTTPFGDPASEAELENLQGTWINDDQESAQVHVAENGELVLGSLQWDDDLKRFRAENLTLKATQVGDIKLLFATNIDEAAQRAYVFGRYELDDDGTLRVHTSIPDRFADAVNAGDLKGTVVKKEKSVSVDLTDSSAAIRDYLAAEGPEEFFNPDVSITVKILKRKE
ncbi:MAG: hypothetical protein ACKVT0_14070 [Planctomycetaceae bacterium]